MDSLSAHDLDGEEIRRGGNILRGLPGDVGPGIHWVVDGQRRDVFAVLLRPRCQDACANHNVLTLKLSYLDCVASPLHIPCAVAAWLKEALVYEATLAPFTLAVSV